MYNKGDENEIYEKTGCLSNCDYFKYTVDHHDFAAGNAFETNPMFNNTLKLELIFKQTKYEMKEEVSVYMMLEACQQFSHHFISIVPVRHL